MARAFSRASETYDKNNLIQNYVAKSLVSKIISDKSVRLGDVLDMGCGTGFLAEQLSTYSNHYVLADISLPLLNVAYEKVKGDHISALVVNGEMPCFTASFDVIVSNLTLHWFQDPKKALSSLAACLKPGGRLFLTTLGNNTFYEWRTAHFLAEVPCGLLEFVSFGQLKDWLPLSGASYVEEDWLRTTPKDAMEFLKGLKGMGGTLAHPGHTPLPLKTFRKVMDVYNKNPSTSYQILYATYQRPEKIREE